MTPVATAFAADYGLTETADQLEAVTAQVLADGKPVGLDIETGYDGEAKAKAQLRPEHPDSFIAGLSLTNSLHWARYVPLRHDGYPNLDNYRAAELMWPVARSGLCTAWNGDFELRWLSRWFAGYLSDHPVFGPEVRAAHLGNPAYPGYFPLLSDPMLETHAEGRARTLKLKPNTEATFGHKMAELTELFALQGGKPLTKREQDAMRFNTLDLMGEHRQDIIDYACEDALWELAHHYKRYYSRAGTLGIGDPRHPQNFIYRLEMAVQPIVCAMEDEGVEVDWAYMREAEVKAGLFRDKLAAEIQAEFTVMLNERGFEGPCTLNLASPKQKATVLYEQLGLPVKRRTKKTAKGGGGTPSTDKIALEGLRKEYPTIQKMLNWTRIETLRHTFLEAYPRQYAYAPDGRTHPNWMQHGVPAGRFACSEWNVQNSPKTYHYELATGETFDHNFRYAVKAPAGWYFLGFDYAQQERRVLAAEANEPALLEVFNSGADIHAATAAMLMGKDLAAITKDERQVGKTLGFAMDYGLAPDSLADRMGIPVEQAEALYSKYFEVNANIKPYQARVIAQARRDGYVITRFGRRVPIWGYDNPRTASDADRVAGNAAIQGPGTGDYPKIAMVRQHEALRRAGLLGKIRLVMNMHDALGWYVHKSVAPLAAIKVLQQAVVFTMPCIAHWPPIVAEWHFGERWGEVRELKVKLDEAGAPVSLEVKASKAVPKAEVSGDDEIPVGEVPQAAVAAVVQPAVPGQQPGVGPGDPGSGGNAGSTNSDGPAPGQVIISVSEMPELEALRRLVKSVRSVPGSNTVLLVVPGEEAMMIASSSGFTPAQWAEAELLLGVDTEVTARSPQAV